MLFLRIKPGKFPEVVSLEKDEAKLEDLQELTGSDKIQAVYPFPELVALICDNEGKINGRPLNRGLYDDRGELYDIIAGDFLILGLPPEDDHGELIGLTQDQIDYFSEYFYSPEMFYRSDTGKISTARLKNEFEAE